MNKHQRAIVPQPSEGLQTHPIETLQPVNRQSSHQTPPQQPIVVVYQQPQHRQSHYQPSPMDPQSSRAQLKEYAAVLLFIGFVIIAGSVMTLAVVHLGNSIYWTSERMHRQVQTMPGGHW